MEEEAEVKPEAEATPSDSAEGASAAAAADSKDGEEASSALLCQLCKSSRSCASDNQRCNTEGHILHALLLLQQSGLVLGCLAATLYGGLHVLCRHLCIGNC